MCPRWRSQIWDQSFGLPPQHVGEQPVHEDARLLSGLSGGVQDQPGQITVHVLDIPHDCCVVLSCVDDVGLSAADQSATAVRAAKLFGLLQAGHDRRRPEGIDGARQRIE